MSMEQVLNRLAALDEQFAELRAQADSNTARLEALEGTKTAKPVKAAPPAAS